MVYSIPDVSLASFNNTVVCRVASIVGGCLSRGRGEHIVLLTAAVSLSLQQLLTAQYAPRDRERGNLQLWRRRDTLRYY